MASLVIKRRVKIKATAEDIFLYLTNPDKIAIWRFGVDDISWNATDDKPTQNTTYKLNFTDKKGKKVMEQHTISKMQLGQLLILDVSSLDGENIIEKFTIDGGAGKNSYLNCAWQKTSANWKDKLLFSLFGKLIARPRRKTFELNTLRIWAALEARPRELQK